MVTSVGFNPSDLGEVDVAVQDAAAAAVLAGARAAGLGLDVEV